MHGLSISRVISGLTFSLLVCCSLAAPAVEPKELTELPIRITAPGIYRIAADLAFKAARGAAISVEADDVTVDLNGHALQGTAGTDSAAVGVRARGQRNITITNGTVSGFYFGIDFTETAADAPRSAKHVLSNLVLTRNHYFGMRVIGSNCAVRHCTVTDTGGCTRPGHTIPIGVRLVGPGNTMRHCSIIDLRLRRHGDGRGEIVGVHFDAAKGAVFEHNHVIELHNSGDDIAADDPKERRFGMWINGGPQKDTWVTVTGNTFIGFPVPLAFAPGSDGHVRGNSFYGAGPKPVRGKPAAQQADNQSFPASPHGG